MSPAPLALLLLAAVTPSPDAPAATPSAATSPAPTATPCFRTLKFGGALYLDADQAVRSDEVGEEVGLTDPNPADCGLPDRLTVLRHKGHNTSEEVVYFVAPGQAELFRTGGQTGYPYQDLLKWLVLLLVVGVVLFAVVPAIVGHVRQPPIEVGRSEDDDEPAGTEVGSGVEDGS
jgi:hypothetical protein